jgi:hypothetical protein
MNAQLYSMAGSAARGVPNYPSFPTGTANKIISDLANDLNALNQSTQNAINLGAPQQIGSVQQSVFNTVDIASEANRALAYNTANMENFKNMASDFNARAVQDKLSAINTMSPGWSDIRENQANVIQSFLQGEVGAGSQAEIARSAAFKNLQGGTMGSNAGAGLSVRDLGLTSAGLQTTGLREANNWSNTLAQFMPEQISGADIMRMQGISADKAIDAAFDNSRLSLQNQQFNIANATAANQFNANAVNQFKQQQAMLALEANKDIAGQRGAIAASQLAVLDAGFNARVGQMNQAEKRNTVLWDARAAAVAMPRQTISAPANTGPQISNGKTPLGVTISRGW